MASESRKTGEEKLSRLLRITGVGDFLLSDRHLQLMHGFDDSRNTYGNHYMATAYFSRGAGPVMKNEGLDSIPQLRPGIPFILDGARYLPGDPGLVKQAILDYGPVYTMLYFKRKDVDTTSFIMRNPENPRNHINHAAVLVGWNDTLTTMEGKGAWILQNSLGPSFGDRGFFYVPYENEDILKHNAVWNAWKPFGDNNRILYYDTLGSFESYGFNDSVCYGLTRYTAAEDCRIVRLATHVNNPGTYVAFEVFSDFDVENKALSGRLTATGDTYCMFPGYYTVDLQQGIDIPAGSDFYVMARYVAPYSTQPLPVEHAIEDYSDPHIMEGTNWVNPDAEKWPRAWYECGPGSPYPALDFDLCIRAIIEIIKN